MQSRPTTTPRRTGPTPGGPALPLALLLAVLLALPGPALAPQAALAGQIRASDLVVSSKVGKVSTSAEVGKTDARSSVHTIDIKRGSHTGEVQVTGQAGRVTTQAGGQNTSADSAVGGVSVGGDK